MTTVIDERVVEMRFNNADFEKNVAQSMSTLEKLKNALNFDSAKSLESIGKASKQFDMSNVGKQVETVQTKFSAMQIVGMTAISELTKAAMALGATIVNKVISPITSGGMNRALNIEQAKFQLEGLHIAWEAIKGDIDYAVSGTAYGLDAAAKTAAQLVASNVQVGDSMKTALRAISGVAAMTNTSYEEISPIFTTVAGQGKLMTMQLRQLESRGLNAAATLAESLGTTEAAIRDMVTKGQIDFDTFAKAMDDAFGEHAKDANKTFTGAMSNVKAALSRIGAEFASPYMENMRKIFVDLIPVLNHVKASLDPIYKRASTVMEIFSSSITSILRSEGLKSGIERIINSLVKAFDGLAKAIYTIKIAFDMVFGSSNFGDVFIGIANAIGTFIEALSSALFTDQNIISFLQFFKGLFDVGKTIIYIFQSVLHALIPVANPLSFILNVVIRFLGFIGNLLSVVSSFIRENLSLANVLNFLAGAAQTVANVLLTIGAAIGGGIIFAIQNFGTVVNYALTKVREFASFIGDKLGGAANAVANKFNSVTGIISKFTSKGKESNTVTKTMQKNYGAAGTAVAEFGTLTREATDDIQDNTEHLSRFQITVRNIIGFFKTAATAVIGGVALIGRTIFAFFTDFGARFATMTANAKSALDFVKGFFAVLGSYIIDIKNKIVGLFNGDGSVSTTPFIEKIKSVSAAIVQYIKDLGAGRIAAIIFAGAMVGLIVAVTKATVAFSTMVTSIRRVFSTVESVIKYKFFTRKSPSLIIQLAESFAIMAASLVLLSMVPADQLAQTAKIMKELLITFAIAAAALRVIDFVISKMGLFSNFKLVNTMLLSLAASIAILVMAFIAINEVTIKDDWKTKLIIMGVMFAELAAAAALISRFAPALSGGSILMLSMALSMKLLVDALAKLGEKDLTQVIENIGAFTALFVGVAMITAAAGRIRLSSALGLLLTAKSLGVILPALGAAVQELLPVFEQFRTSADRITILLDAVRTGFTNLFAKIKSFFTFLYLNLSEVAFTIITSISMVGAVAGLVGGLFGIAAIITAIGRLGNLLKGFAFAIVGAAIAFKIVAESLKELGDYLGGLTDAQYNRLMEGLITIVAALTLMITAVTVLDALATFVTKNHILDGPTRRTNFLGIGIAFVGIGAAINLIAHALNTMQDLPMDKFWSLIGGMSVLLIALGLAAAGTGLITRGGAALVGLAGIMVSMALLIAGAGIISAMWTPETERGLIGAFAGIFVVAGSLALVLTAFSKLHNAPSILSVMIPVMMMVITLAGLFAYVGTAETINTGAIIGAFIGIAVIMGEVVVILRLIARIHGLTNPAKMGIIIAVAAMLGVVALSLIGLAATIRLAGAGTVIGAFALLNLQIFAIYQLMAHIATMRGVGTTMPSRLALLKTCVGAFAALAIVIGLFAAACKHIGFGNVIGAMVLMNIQLGAIYLMMEGVTRVKMDGMLWSRLTLLGSCIIALGVVAIALGALASSVKKNGIQNFKTAFEGLAITFGLLGGVMAAVGFVCSMVHEIKQVVAMGVLAAGAIGMIAIITFAITKLSEIDQGSLQRATETMWSMIGAITVMTAILGVIQLLLVGVGSIFGSAAGGWAGAMALPALILAIGFAFSSISTGLYLGAKAIEILAAVLERLIPILRDLETIPADEIGIKLIQLGKGMLIAAVGVGALGLASLVGFVGIALLAAALQKLAPQLEPFATGLQKVADADIGSVVAGMLELAVVSLALGKTAGSVMTYAGAMYTLAGSLNAFNGVSLGGVKEGLTVTPGGLSANANAWSGMNTAVKTSIDNQEAAMETHVVHTQQYYDELTTVAQTGTISRYDAEEEATKTGINGVENTVKEGAKKVSNSWQDTLTREATKDAGVVNSLKKKTSETVDSLKTTVKNGVGELVTDAKTELANFNISDALNSLGLPDIFGNMGTICGAMFGNNASRTAADAISKMMGSFDWLFKQSGLMNAANKEISQFGANGMPTQVANEMYKGVASTGAKIFTKNLGDTFSNLKETIGGLVKPITDVGDAMEGAGASGSKGAKGVKEFGDSLKDTISNQLDIFSKFEIKTSVTAQQMLENMKSNIDGFASWSHRMTVLAERGIDQGLYQKLAELGPKGYETMNAFYEMTEDELKQANELFATSLTLPQSQADIVTAGFTYAGEMATQGFSHALDDHKAAHEAAHGLGQSAIDGVNEALQVSSPSRKTMETGYYTVLGLANGIDAFAKLARTSADFMAFDVLDVIRRELKQDKFKEIGENIVLGLIEGLKSNHDELKEASLKIAEVVNETIRKKEEISSPSKLMKRFGDFITDGLALGIKESASNVAQAAEYVVDDVNGVFDNMGRIQEAINTSLDYNPVITPLLDLSLLNEQMNSVNGLFEDQRLGATFSTDQNGGSDTPQTIQFTQNNYSPKALSRIDIYRQTKNEVSMMKGALAHA